MASAGVPPKQLQAFLGHGDISITYDVYVHLADEDTIATSSKMDDILEDVKARPDNPEIKKVRLC